MVVNSAVELHLRELEGGGMVLMRRGSEVSVTEVLKGVETNQRDEWECQRGAIYSRVR